MSISPDAKNIWTRYFERAQKWAEEITPEFIQTIGQSSETPVISLFDYSVITATRPMVNRYAKELITQAKAYINDVSNSESRCARNPWIYHTFRHLNEVDISWMEGLIANRDGRPNEILSQLEEAAEDLSHPEKCYPMKYTKNIFGEILKL